MPINLFISRRAKNKGDIKDVSERREDGLNIKGEGFGFWNRNNAASRDHQPTTSAAERGPERSINTAKHMTERDEQDQEQRRKKIQRYGMRSVWFKDQSEK